MSLAWFGFFTAFITSIFCIVARVGGDFLLGAEYTRRPSIIWNVLGFLATYLIVAWIFHAFINLRRELEERINSRTAALAREVFAREQLQRELIEISERERRTIGNDLHDGLSQHLTAMAFAAGVLKNQLAHNDRRAQDTANDLLCLAEEGILQSRQLARGLLLMAIEPVDLHRELGELAVTIQRQYGVRCHYEVHDAPLPTDSNMASHIFRIAQEAVLNAIKHAQPTTLTLTLAGGAQTLVLSVRDNGPGLPVAEKRNGGVGLRVMANRAKLIGGELTLESSPGEGTLISCRVPLPTNTCRPFTL